MYRHMAPLKEWPETTLSSTALMRCIGGLKGHPAGWQVVPNGKHPRCRTYDL